MSRITPLPNAEVPDSIREITEFSEQFMGFTANDVLTMAKWPELLKALEPLINTIYGPGEIDGKLKPLIALVTSTASGCRYCQAHTAHGAAKFGAPIEKIQAAWEFETSELFSDAERAALRIARGAGSQPNGTSDKDFVEARKHYSERQILEIVGVAALFGFLNRWNTTLKTDLEDEPAEAAQALLKNT